MSGHLFKNALSGSSSGIKAFLEQKQALDRFKFKATSFLNEIRKFDVRFLQGESWVNNKINAFRQLTTCRTAQL